MNGSHNGASYHNLTLLNGLEPDDLFLDEAIKGKTQLVMQMIGRAGITCFPPRNEAISFYEHVNRMHGILGIGSNIWDEVPQIITLDSMPDIPSYIDTELECSVSRLYEIESPVLANVVVKPKGFKLNKLSMELGVCYLKNLPIIF